MEDERFVLTLKSWMSDPPVTGYKEVAGGESRGTHGAFGIRIFVTVNHDLSRDASIEIRKAQDMIEAAVLTDKLRRDPESKIKKDNERIELLGLFPEMFQVEELPNGYCNKWCCTQLPWYRVLTKIGWVKIGWRKSVINIDWSDTVVKQSGDDLFPGVSFTVGSGHHSGAHNSRYCHAHGIENAGRQLAVVLSAEREKPAASKV